MRCTTRALSVRQLVHEAKYNLSICGMRNYACQHVSKSCADACRMYKSY